MKNKVDQLLAGMTDIIEKDALTSALHQPKIWGHKELSRLIYDETGFLIEESSIRRYREKLNR